MEAPAIIVECSVNGIDVSVPEFTIDCAIKIEAATP
jgi:hypothetical protein